MHHYFEAITNTSGDSLVGYFARVIDPVTQNTVTMSADDNGTPIVTKSGVDNMGSTDDYGNLDFYVVPGTYHLDIYAPNATSFIFRVPNVAMNSSKGDPGPQGDEGPAGEGLAEVMAPTGASKVGAQSPETGAAAISQAAKNLTSVSIFEFIDPSLHAEILARTVNNSKTAAVALTTAMDTAFARASAKRRTVTVPAGLYNIAPLGRFTAEAGDILRCFAIRNNLHIMAEPGATFRIVNGVSSDAAPEFMCMFGTNEILNDVSWYGLEMDMNGANNLFSPARNTGGANNGYNLYNQAQIHVTGTIAGQAARINNATVDRCRFINGWGVSNLVMGQSNTLNSGIGYGWTVRDCFFGNGGYDTVDCSFIYAWAGNVLIDNITIENPTQFGLNGGLVGIEIHGPNTVIRGCKLKRLYQGIWADGNGSVATRNCKIIDTDLLEIGAFGILGFGAGPIPVVYGITIENVTIELDDTVYAGVDLKYGIGTAGQYSQKDFRILNCSVTGIGNAVAKAAVAITAGTVSGQKHDRWLIDNLYAENVTIGVLLSANATVGLGTMTIRNVRPYNLIAAGVIASPQGVAISSGAASIEEVEITGLRYVRNNGVTVSDFGIRAEGMVGRYTSRNNLSTGAATAYAEVGFTATSRKGEFFQTFPYDPPSLANGANVAVYIPVPNLTFNDDVIAKMNVSTQGVTVTSWVEVAAVGATPGTAAVFFQNLTGSATPIDIVSGSILLTILKGP